MYISLLIALLWAGVRGSFGLFVLLVFFSSYTTFFWGYSRICGAIVFNTYMMIPWLLYAQKWSHGRHFYGRLFGHQFCLSIFGFSSIRCKPGWCIGLLSLTAVSQLVSQQMRPISFVNTTHHHKHGSTGRPKLGLDCTYINEFF